MGFRSVSHSWGHPCWTLCLKVRRNFFSRANLVFAGTSVVSITTDLIFSLILTILVRPVKYIKIPSCLGICLIIPFCDGAVLQGRWWGVWLWALSAKGRQSCTLLGMQPWQEQAPWRWAGHDFIQFYSVKRSIKHCFLKQHFVQCCCWHRFSTEVQLIQGQQHFGNFEVQKGDTISFWGMQRGSTDESTTSQGYW